MIFEVRKTGDQCSKTTRGAPNQIKRLITLSYFAGRIPSWLDESMALRSRELKVLWFSGVRLPSWYGTAMSLTLVCPESRSFSGLVAYVYKYIIVYVYYIAFTASERTSRTIASLLRGSPAKPLEHHVGGKFIHAEKGHAFKNLALQHRGSLPVPILTRKCSKDSLHATMLGAHGGGSSGSS